MYCETRCKSITVKSVTMVTSDDVVKRLLASTDPSRDTTAIKKVDTSKSPKRNKNLPANSTTVSKEAIVKAHISSLLALDRAITDKDAKVKHSLRRLERVDRAKARHNNATQVHFGRTSASHAAIVHVPTFDKKKHKLLRKKLSIEKIAKLLKNSDK
jgi:hypothetical protein